jgi:transcriptional regulator with XRE-family HTH domain
MGTRRRAMASWSSQIVRDGQSPRTQRFVRGVRVLREEAGLTRRELEEKIRRLVPETPIRAELIRDLELGRRFALTLDEALAICGGLEVPLADVIDHEWKLVRMRVNGDEGES